MGVRVVSGGCQVGVRVVSGGSQGSVRWVSLNAEDVGHDSSK